MRTAALRLAVPALLAAAPALGAQAVPRGPHLLRVAATSEVVLSLDSAAIARTGDSTFVVDAVYQRGAVADREVETQEMDCGRVRVRGRHTTYFDDDLPRSVTQPEPLPGWQQVGEDELPSFEAICGYLLGSFATSLPVTLEAVSADEPPELSNGFEVAQALSSAYPRALRNAGTAGTVLLRLQIRPNGSVDPATARALWATRSEFADAARLVVRRMRFRPARVGGRAVAAWVTFPISFALFNDGLPVPPGPQRTPSRGPTIQPPARP